MKIICQWCNKEFEAKRSNTKYCSRSCSAKASRQRKKDGINPYEKICNKCGEKFTIKENAFSRRYCYNCVPIAATSGAESRRLIKQWALEYKGKSCSICGYDKCYDALDFHHLNQDEKEFILSDRNLTCDWNEVKKELDKCILVCANCHREIHSKKDKI